MSRCPVHLCNPATAKTLEARESGLCERHEGKVSPPLLQSLLFAQKDPERDATGQLEAAVIEARANDGEWMPFALRHDGRVECFETAADTFERVLALTGARPAWRGSKPYTVDAEAKPVAIKSCETGERLTIIGLAAMLGPKVEHVAKVEGNGVVARGETLGELLPKLGRKGVRDASGEGPLVVVNAWTREEMTPAAAAARAGGLR